MGMLGNDESIVLDGEKRSAPPAWLEGATHGASRLVLSRPAPDLALLQDVIPGGGEGPVHHAAMPGDDMRCRAPGAVRSVADPGAQQGDELAQPGRVGRPGGGGDQIAVGDGLVNGDVGVASAGQFHLGTAGRVGGAQASFKHACSGQQLGAMAYCRDWLVGAEEVTDQRNHCVVHPQVFWPAPAWNHQRIVVAGIDIVEAGIQRKVMSTFFAVGLVALEIMNRGGDAVARLLARTHRMYGMADRKQGLERHHGFVVLAVVTANHQYLLAHVGLLGRVVDGAWWPSGQVCDEGGVSGWYGSTTVETLSDLSQRSVRRRVRPQIHGIGK